MSLHKSKGFTSKVVIIADCIDGLIPTYSRDDTTLDQKKSTLQEQRRLFYVAITRAAEVLVLSSVTNLSNKLAYKIGARVTGYGATLTSTFISQLGPTAPAAKSGLARQRNRYK